ncbi:phosphatidate cytidylyltransferase [Flavobacterium magnum]|uniref:Phosphatidate cytidylyltransferase n=1 Tax=Flavobacterium magnum TaxID=2162713 RepID=A0A2S0RFR7_9FLAO|nr:phosphatidate cytidylyltransferase [Flavobacterium magnum]AWA30379.1 phosphatidate cytidylyltransferase [Flavobacterium magnum]
MNETLKRGISGAVYVILLIASIYYSTETFFLLFGIFLIIAVFEFCSLVRLPVIFPVLLSLSAYGTISYMLFSDIRLDRNFDLALLALTMLVSIKGIIFLFSRNRDTVSTFSKYAYLAGYIILPFVIITKIPFGIKGYNPKILIGIFILVWTNDTFAYLVGKSIGRHKLYERISPKKTIEGFLGGVAFAVLAGFLISKYYIEGGKLAQNIWIGFALIMSVFGTIGDLIESKFKRIAGVKDSGKIMPGHGGILDRLDSVIFAAPFIFLFYQILNFI